MFECGVLRAAAIAAVLFLPAGSIAAEGKDHHGHGAHVHGVAALNLAVEGDQLYLELRSPAANLVGFEHAPADASEHAMVKRVRGLLSDPTTLFTLPERARCRAVDVSIQIPWGGLAAEEDVPQDAAGDRDRSGPHDDGGHADIDAAYRLRCDEVSALDSLRAGVFASFPSLRHLQVQYIVGDRQGGAVLTSEQPILRF